MIRQMYLIFFCLSQTMPKIIMFEVLFGTNSVFLFYLSIIVVKEHSSRVEILLMHSFSSMYHWVCANFIVKRMFSCFIAFVRRWQAYHLNGNSAVQ